MPSLNDPNGAAIWMLKLSEEVGEVGAALLGRLIGKEGRGDVKQELAQVVAVALAMWRADD